MVRLTLEEREALSEWIATKATNKIYNIFAKLGFSNVGHLIDVIEKYNEVQDKEAVS